MLHKNTGDNLLVYRVFTMFVHNFPALTSKLYEFVRLFVKQKPVVKLLNAQYANL